MFKMIVGGNGRSVYCGKVTRINEKAIEIFGTDYNKDTGEVQRTLQLWLDRDIVEKAKEVKEGDIVAVPMLPSRKNQDIGTAEELAVLNDAIVMQNDRGNEKIMLIGKIRKKKTRTGKTATMRKGLTVTLPMEMLWLWS